MSILRFSLYCVLSAAFASGCGRGPTPVQVSGKVVLDGKPMPEGEISFIGPGKGPEVLQVSNGAFAGLLLPGEKRVEVRYYKGTTPRPSELPPDKPWDQKMNVLPDRYNAKSSMKATVSATGQLSPDLFDLSMKGGAKAIEAGGGI